MLKSMVRKLANKTGYDFVRKPDPYRLDLYRQIFSEEVLRRRPFYNIGAGTFSHPYWTSVDFDTEWYGKDRDIVHYDLMKLEPLPIEGASAKIIYSSHTVEHVSDDAVQNLCNEAFRCLEPGGLLRITTGPDAETDYRAMLAGDEDWFYWSKNYNLPGTYEHLFKVPAMSVPIEERWLHHVASQLAPHSHDDHKKVTASEIRELAAKMSMEEVLDYLTGQVSFDPKRPGNHMSWWTHAKLEKFIRNAGFTTVYRSGYGQSASPLMRQSPLFDSTHPQISIYVEAVR